ncbi:MAG: hypothetical protein J6U86_06100 [Clostridia bacterium]|nr:hypothetical protein [Clostridia bacterium]
MKYKKILCLALTLGMSIGVLGAVRTSAVDNAVLSDHFIMHWDFEGETEQERLSNKAPNGSQADLEYRTTGLSSISNGVANISSKSHERLAYLALGNEALDECNEGYTVFLRVKVSSEGGWPWVYNLFWIKGSDVSYVRYIVENAAIEDSPLSIRPRLNGPWGDTTNTAPNELCWKMDEYATIAVSARAENGKYIYDFYSGKDLARLSLETIPDQYVELMNSAAEFVFPSGKQMDAQPDHEKDTSYDDIRIYNRALTEKGVRAVVAEIEGTTPVEYSDVKELFYAKASDFMTEEEQPKTEVSTESEATTTEATVIEIEVGCGSALIGIAFVPAIAAAGVAVGSRKKRK